MAQMPTTLGYANSVSLLVSAIGVWRKRLKSNTTNNGAVTIKNSAVPFIFGGKMKKYQPIFKHLFVKVKIVRDGYKAGPVIKSPENVIKSIEDMIIDRDREVFIVLHLNARNTVVAIEEVSVGSVDATIVHPREVFKAALLCNASSVILVHNHPSGNTAPSEDDKNLTKKLIDGGEILGIEVLDHVIVGNEGNYLSFKDSGLIPEVNHE